MRALDLGVGMAGGTRRDETWGFWFRHHWLRYGFVTLGLFVDILGAGELLQLAPRPVPWYWTMALVAMVGGLAALEVFLYRRLFPRTAREGFNGPAR